MKVKIVLLFSIFLLVLYPDFSWAKNGLLLDKLDLPKVKENHPKIESSLWQLAEEKKDGKVKVILEFYDEDKIDIASLEKYGIEIETRYKNQVRAWVPINRLVEIADNVPNIRLIRQPHIPYPMEVSEGVGLIGATNFHTNDINGSGVKIGIVDIGFENYDDVIAHGDLPSNIIAHDFSSDNDVEIGGKHGTGVAEIIHDVAPGAQLYLMKIGDALDLGSIKEYCIGEGIDIINSSIGWYNTNFYDGTGIICGLVNDLKSLGILWVNSAGNAADGEHWEGMFTDTNGNGIHEFSSGNETNSFTVTAPPDGIDIAIYLTWDAWESKDQDYDLYLLDENGDPLESSINRQTFYPVEHIFYHISNSGTYNIAIHKYSASSNHKLELFVRGPISLEYSVAESSIPAPGNSENALTVGAIDEDRWHWGSNLLQSYSSQGPTNDGRIKPDLCGPDDVQNFTHGTFPGTSASSAHVSGAAALLLSANLDLHIEHLRVMLEQDAIDIDSIGKDNKYGFGKLNLPSSPSSIIAINPYTATLGVGDTVQFTASGGTPSYTWTSSNTNVGTIDHGGVFMAVGEGACTITVTDSAGYSATSGIIDVHAEVLKIKNYMPLPINRAWTYEKTDSEGTKTITERVVGTRDVNGIETTVIRDSDGEETFLTVDSNGLRLHGGYAEIEGLGWTTVTLSPPETLAKENFYIGDLWQATVNATYSGYGVISVEVRTEILGFETITVPAGTFGTVAIEEQATLGGVTLTSTYYLAKGIGIVKDVYVNDEGEIETNVLQSFNFPVGPTNPSITLTDRETSSSDRTTSLTVRVNLSVDDANYYMVSEDSNFTGANWVYYSYSPSSIYYTFVNDTECPKKIYAKFKNIYDVESEIVSDIIIYDTGLRNIIINEFVPNPDRDNVEWVELYNKGTEHVNIGGCWLDDVINGGSNPIQLPNNEVIWAGGYYSFTLYIGDGYLNNGGDTINFLKPNGVTVIDTKSYGDVTGSPDFSFYRFPDGQAWAEDMDNTPTRDAANDGPSNFAPVLSAGSVSPPVGTTFTRFTYTVTYTDKENDPPTSIAVSIDGSPGRPMDKEDSEDDDYTDGCVYLRIWGLAKSSHNYRFSASDGISSATGDIDLHDGPTVNNTPPSITGATVTPETAYETTTLTAVGVGWSDADRDPEGYKYQWYNQSGEIPLATSGTLTGADFNKGDEVYCLVTPFDGEDSGVAQTSNTVTILNSTPSITGVSIGPDPAYTNTNLTAAPIGWSDADEDAAEYAYKWQKKDNGSWTDIPGAISQTLDSSNFARGDKIKVICTPDDGETTGASQETIIAISNSTPSITAATIGDEPAYTNDTLTATATGWNDADEDLEGYTYQWYNQTGEISKATSDTLQGTYFNKDDQVYCVITPFDGTDSGEARTSNTITILNSAPSITDATIGPELAYTNTELTATANGWNDVDGDTQGYNYQWHNQTGEIEGAISSSLQGTYFNKGDQIYCVVTPFDGTDSGAAKTSNMITILNSAPSVAGVSISPDLAYTNTDLTATPTGWSDTDGDTEGYRYQWYNQSGEITGATLSTLTSSYFNKGDQLYCEVTPFDEGEDGTSQTSNTITILNSEPSITGVSISPIPAYSDTDLTAAPTGWSDADEDTEGYIYKWQKNENGVWNDISGETSDTLDSSYFTGGDQIKIICTPDDGEISGVPQEDTVTIGNSPPSITGVTIGPELVYTNDTLTATATGWFDADGDTEGYKYQWHNQSGEITGATADTLQGTDFNKGDQIYCDATPFDGKDDGESQRSNTITILNSAPSIAGVTITPDPVYTNTNLTATPIGWNDADGDAEGYTYKWQRWDGGWADIPGAISQTLDSSNFTRGDQIKVICTPDDGETTGASQEATITISNSTPSITTATIGDEPAYTNDTLTATATGWFDADGDTEGYTYQWHTQSGEIPGATVDTLQGADYFDKGDEVYCIITPDDAIDSGASKTSNTIIIQNTPPTQPEVAQVTPAIPTISEDLLCTTLGSSDVDLTDTVTYQYQWYKNSSLVPEQTSSTLSYTLTSLNDKWKCEATPTDGDDVGPPKTSDEVTIIADLSITPASATVWAGVTKEFSASGGAPPYTWSCDDEEIGVVDPDGLFTAKKSGTCNVQVTDSYSRSVSSVVTVPFPAPGWQESAICIEESEQSGPTISGDRIVWLDPRNEYFSNIYMYDIATQTETAVTSDDALRVASQIHADKIVWIDVSVNTGSIYLYDISEDELHTVYSSINVHFQCAPPHISENYIVWEERPPDGSSSHVYVHKIKEEDTGLVTLSDSEQLSPDISGELIVWQDNRNGSWDVYMYDIDSEAETAICTNEYNQTFPRISGDKIVWIDERNGNPDVYMYDISTGEEKAITSDDISQANLAIDGDKLVYQDFLIGDDGEIVSDDIHIFNITAGIDTIFEIEPGNQWYVDISGNRVVYGDNRNGNYDVFIAELIFGNPSIVLTDIVTGSSDYTHSQTVKAELNVTNGVAYMLSEDPHFTGQDWITATFPTTIEYTFNTAINEEKTVYTKFKSAEGMETEIASDTIIMEIQVPFAPSSFSATCPPNSREVTLSWQNPPDIEFEGTMIRRKKGIYPADINDGEEIYYGSEESVVDMVPEDETTYYYTAWACDDMEHWSASYVSTEVQSGDTVAPASITDFDAQAKTNESAIELSWEKPDPLEDYVGVRIRRKIDSYPATVTDGVQVVDSTDTSYVDENLSDMTHYYYVAFPYDEVRNYGSPSLSTAMTFEFNAPYLDGLNPAEDNFQVSCDTNILLHIKDDQSGVDIDSIYLNVDGEVLNLIEPNEIPIEEREDYQPYALIKGDASDYIILYDPQVDFPHDKVVNVTIKASDLMLYPNSMSHSFSFITQMMTISSNVRVNGDEEMLRDFPCIVCDSNGKNIFVTWEGEDEEGSRNIYLAKSTDRGLNFGPEEKLFSGAINHKMARSSDGIIYLIWTKALTSSNYGLYFAKSEDDGESFSLPKLVANFAIYGVFTAPDIAAHAGKGVFIVWKDYQDGKEGISFAEYDNVSDTFTDSIRIDDDLGYGIKSLSMSIDQSGDAYVAWSAPDRIFFDKYDKKNNSFGEDRLVYAGASIEKVSLDVRPNGKDIYIAWDGIRGADRDILFTKSEDGGEGFEFDEELKVVDDSGNNPQMDPTLKIDKSGDIYIVWRDKRNDLDGSFGCDIYLVESLDRGNSFRTNILINDDTDSIYHLHPDLALNESGKQVNVCWTDYRNYPDRDGADIYFASNTVVALLSKKTIEADSGGTVDIDGASVIIPEDALDSDTTITISEVENPPPPPQGSHIIAVPIDFGPGGTKFNEPVTIRIPYTEEDLINVGITESNYTLSIYYFDTVTNTWTEIPNCITTPEYVEGTVTHFSLFGIIGSIGSGASKTGTGAGCFIATAAYGTPMSEEVKILREFRDKYLVTNTFGKKLISIYYKYSPPIADYIAERKYLKFIVRALLKPIVRLCKSYSIEETEVQIVSAPVSAPAQSIPEEVVAPFMEQEKKPELNLRLLGTILGSSDIAYIEDLASGATHTYEVGEEITGAKIIDIQLGRVTLERDGQKEILSLAGTEEGPITKISPTKMVVSKREVLEEINGNINKVLTMARIFPYFDFTIGRFSGVKVDGIQKDSIVERAGLQNGDIIKIVNGQKLDNPHKAIQIFRKVRRAPQIEVGLLRKKALVKLKYEIKD